VAAFVADCRARNLSPRTVEFYLEGLTSFRSFAGGHERPLVLRDLQLDTARAWLADLVRSGRRPATVAARARALRTFSAWALAETYVRTDPLTRLTRGPTSYRTLMMASLRPAV